MAPPQDVVMGPPPLPPQGGPPQKHKEPDLAAKYSRLKRKYFDLEEVSNRVRFSSCSFHSASLVIVTSPLLARDHPERRA